MNVNWRKLKQDKDAAQAALRREGGDFETKADIDYLLKHKDESFGSFEELRARRKALASRIDAEAKAERRRIEQERQEARIKALESFTIAHLNEHIFVTINGKRLKKIKRFEDLKCPHCGQFMHVARGMCIEMAEHYMQYAPSNGSFNSVRPPIKLESVKCQGCGETCQVLVQVVY